MTEQPVEDRPPEFSAALRAEIAKALSGYLANGERGRDRLRRATQQVCTEAHQLELTPETMVVALQHLFERTPLSGSIAPDRRRAAFEEFMQSCIAAYFNADDSRS